MMDDLINRQKVLRLIRTTIPEEAVNSALLYQAVSQMDSEEPKQKVGKWNIWAEDRTEWYHVTCSECVEDVTATIPLIGMFPNYKALWNFCPYCGTKMEVEDGRLN